MLPPYFILSILWLQSKTNSLGWSAKPLLSNYTLKNVKANFKWKIIIDLITQNKIFIYAKWLT